MVDPHQYFVVLNLLSDEDVRKNSKVAKQNNFRHFSRDWLNSETLSRIKVRTKQSSNEKSLSTTSRFDNDLSPFSQNLLNSEVPSGKRDKPIRNKKTEVNCKKSSWSLFFSIFAESV